MKTGFFHLFCIALFILAAVGGNPIQAGIVTNGSFESDTITNGTGWQLFPSLTGWTVDTVLSAPGVTSTELQNGVAGTAFSGSQFVELDSTGSSFIYQDLTTTPGQQYFLTWAFSPRPQYSNCVGTPQPANCQPSGGQSITEDGTENHLRVLAGVPGSLAVVYDGSASGIGLFNASWIVNTVNFTATNTTTRVEFGDAGTSDGYGSFLDGVNADIVSAPEPGTVFMIGAGALAILVSRAGKSCKTGI